MKTPQILEVDSLTFSYPESPDVLNDVNLSIADGERVALIGPNGSGKTTLFLLMCGILKPTAGGTSVNGSLIRPGGFHPDIGYLFQFPDDQLFSSTVFDDVAFGPLNMSLSRDEVRRRVDRTLSAVGCGGLSDRPPHHLSGGEKRLIAIASVLSMVPRLILFDEPTSNLDSRNRRRVIEVLSTLDQTLIVASHDLEFLLETCLRVVLLDFGKVVADRPIRDLFSDEELLRAHGLEKPHSLVPHTHRTGSFRSAD